MSLLSGLASAGLLAATLALAGCATDADGQAASFAVAADGPQSDLVPQFELRDTGTYPNINDEPRPSLEQFSAGERAALVARARAVRQAHNQGRISDAVFRRQLAQLRRLARTHSDDMVARIEAAAAP